MVRYFYVSERGGGESVYLSDESFLLCQELTGRREMRRQCEVILSRKINI